MKVVDISVDGLDVELQRSKPQSVLIPATVVEAAGGSSGGDVAS